MDDDLIELMRQADPARTTAIDRYELEIRSELRRITQRSLAKQDLRTRTRWPWFAVPAVVVAVVVVAVLTQMWNPPYPVAAATPPRLVRSRTSLDVGGAMDRALSQLTPIDSDEAQRCANLEGWYLQTEIGTGSQSASVVSPQEQELIWNEHLAGTITLTAGRSYVLAEGSPSAPCDANAPTPGTVLSRDTFPAGEMPVLFQTPPPSTAPEMRRYLAATLAIDFDADAVDYLSAVRVLMSEWTLSSAQQAAVLSTLRELDGLDVAGEVTDRLGRPGIAFRATSPNSPYFENLFIVSTETGRILALETLYLGGLSELASVPAHSVIDYVAWK
jgi:hypothetical protein